MTDKRLVLTTTASVEEARSLARGLVERKLAACVNIVPRVESIYNWQGKVEEAAECLLVIKSNEASWPSLREAILELHTYDVPEVIMVAIEDGAPGYLQWLGESVERSGN